MAFTPLYLKHIELNKAESINLGDVMKPVLFLPEAKSVPSPSPSLVIVPFDPSAIWPETMEAEVALMPSWIQGTICLWLCQKS
jgi:hypothetical protein